MNDAAVAPPVGRRAGAPPLDDVMLAMDVVDTLRRRERLVVSELAEAGREQDLKERLRKIYAAQGIDVSDHILEEGVAALKEGRFVYKPPGPGLGRWLAHLYVRRKRWGKWVAGGVAAIVLAVAVNHFVFVAPKASLPGDLAAVHAEVVAIEPSADARESAERLLQAGQDAVGDGDTATARAALEALQDLRTVLQQDYMLRIVNRPDTPTGVWRVPDVNSAARNYYIIVEALDSAGRPVKVPVRSEETGKVQSVPVWGLRVEQPVFAAVARDKQDNGIIENDLFGRKQRGELVPDYAFATTGAAITEW